MYHKKNKIAARVMLGFIAGMLVMTNNIFYFIIGFIIFLTAFLKRGTIKIEVKHGKRKHSK